MSGDSGVVKNWLPGEPGKYVTILDLKEQWMKKMKHEKEEEGKRKKKMKEEEKREEEEEEKKVFERLDEMKIVGVDRVEGKCVEVGNGRWKSGGKGRSRRRRSEVGGSKTRIDERKGGYGELVRVLKTEKSEYKKKGLEVNDVRANGDDVVGNKVGSGRYWSVKRISRDGSAVKGMVSGVTENVGVDVDVDDEKSEEVDSIGNEKGIRTNCPCHSKVDNQGGGGFWVCKYVEQVPRAEIGQIMTGNEAAKGDTADNAWKKNDRMKEVKLEKKHQLPRKLIEEMTTEREKEDVKHGHGDFPRVVNHDDVMRKGWQPREKWEMTKGVNDEVMGKQIQREEMDVDKDMRTIISHDGSSKKSVMKDQSETVEPSFEIEKHSKASLVNEREMICRGKFRDKDSPVDRREIYDTGMYKAEKNFGSLPMDYVKKDTTHVNSGSKKLINQNGSQRAIIGSTLKLENSEPVDCPEKSDAALCTKMVENSSVRFRDTRNGNYPRKPFVNKRLQTERIVTNERLTNSGKVYGQRERRMEREGFMWVRKGDVLVGDTEGSK